MESITATDAGTYTIWYKVDGGTNYKNLGPTKIGTVSIDKAAVTETVAISENPTYGSDITLTATVASKTVDAANISGTVQFKVGEEPLGEPVTVQEGTATLKIGAADAVLQKLLFGESGTSAITAAYSGTGNIAPDIGTTTVSMEKKALTYKVSAQDKTYDGTTTVSVTLTPTNLVGEDAVTLAATGNVAKPDIGDYDTVDLTGIVLSGDDAKYYAVDGSKSGVTLAPPVKILERHKEDGTGMVSMADYTCGDTSVEPKAVSETNVGAAVSITYKPKDAPDTAYSPTKPTTAGEYTVRAVFAATEQYNEVTATADFTITHQFPTSLEENEDFICACEADLRLEAESIEAIPPALQETYSNVEELSRVLVNATGVSGADYTVYDVKLELKEGSEAWHDAPEDSIPASGLTITLPYPAGTDSSYTFTVIHMFAYGEKAGSTEKPAVTNTADGIRFTVSGLSPVCIAWTSPDDTPRYYVVIADNLRGGTVSADKTYVLAGDTVTLTVTPENGYRLSSLTVTDAAGSPLKLTDNGDGTYTFVQPSGDVTVTAASPAVPSLHPQPAHLRLGHSGGRPQHSGIRRARISHGHPGCGLLPGLHRGTGPVRQPDRPHLSGQQRLCLYPADWRGYGVRRLCLVLQCSCPYSYSYSHSSPNYYTCACNIQCHGTGKDG